MLTTSRSKPTVGSGSCGSSLRMAINAPCRNRQLGTLEFSLVPCSVTSLDTSKTRHTHTDLNTHSKTNKKIRHYCTLNNLSSPRAGIAHKQNTGKDNASEIKRWIGIHDMLSTRAGVVLRAKHSVSYSHMACVQQS